MRLIICLMILIQLANSRHTKECGTKADVVFVLDSSGSVGPANWRLMLKFVENVVRKFTIGRNHVQVGVDIFGTSVSTQIRLNSYDSKARIIRAVRRIRFLRSGTNTYLAIQHMTRNSFSSFYGHRAGVPKIGIVVTDGKSSSRYKTTAAANNARNNGIKLFSIGVGRNIDLTELKAIGNNDLFFQVNDFRALKSIESSLVSKACGECGTKADVVFVLDSSGSVGLANWRLMLKFVQNVVNKFTIGRNHVQVGVDIFGTSVSTQIRLNSYDSKAKIMRAVRRIGFLSSGTNTYLAIRHMTRNSFSSYYGHHAGVPKVGIVVTDGVSSSRYKTIAAANYARYKGIKLFSIGVGRNIDLTELKGIGNNGLFFHVNDFRTLKTIESTLVSKACGG